jgi:uncharacterized protein
MNTQQPFIGRAAELDDLDAMVRLPGAKLIVIKGRRRIGKSRLARELGMRHPELSTYYLTGLPPTELASAQAVLDNFAAQISRTFDMPRPAASSWDDLLWHIADRVRDGKAIVILDEISWLGRSDPLFSARLWQLWETGLSVLPSFILILSGSLAGWIDDQFSSNTGYLGRISWNMTLQELPVREALHFFGDRGERLSMYERLKILLVTGGVPRYLELMDPHLTADDNIRRLCFTPQGLLFNEYDQLLNDLFQRKNSTYREIIEALADRPLTLKQLHSAIGKARSGVLSAHIEELEKTGFLARHFTWDPHDGAPSNQYKVRISDNYLRFYLKAIRPHAKQIVDGVDALPASLPGVLGFQFENLVLKNRRLLWSALSIQPREIVRDGPYFQTATTRRRGCQIDYLIQTRHSLFVVEIKLSSTALDTQILRAARRKMQALTKPKHLSVRPVLVHVNGVTDSVLAADYYDRVLDFGGLAADGQMVRAMPGSDQ